MIYKQYKKNDIIEAIENIDGLKIKKGLKGKVLKDCVSYVSVEWFEYVNGHTGDTGMGKQGYCWNVGKELIKKAVAQLEFEF